MGSGEKIVLISDTLTTDVLMGNMHGLATVWCHKYSNETDTIK